MRIGMQDNDAPERDRLDFNSAPQTGFSSVASSIGTRNLLIIIVTMPLVFLVVVMTIISVFGGPNDAQEAAAPGSVRSTPVATLDEPGAAGQRAVLPVPAAAESLPPGITLPAGAKAGAIALDGDRLAVRVDAEDGAMIVIYDLATDAVVKTIPLTADGDER